MNLMNNVSYQNHLEQTKTHYLMDQMEVTLRVNKNKEVTLRKGQKNVQVPSRPFGDPSRPYALEGGMYVCL